MPAPLELEDAQARLLALAAPLPVERMPASEALGRYLAEPLVARRTQPPATFQRWTAMRCATSTCPGRGA